MDVNKNSYTFGFATIMVVIVAAVLSYTYITLKPRQDRNVELERKQSILRSVGIHVERDLAEVPYDKYIRQSMILNIKGEIVDGLASDLDLANELKKEPENQRYPLYISKEDDKNKYIIPLRGKGLWGPVWGYIALENDLNTVFGAVFDHKAETPGLGAEINTPMFQDPFSGKEIYNESGEFVSISVVKGTVSSEDLHSVNGISGGTITSDGVSDMLKERLEKYLPYFEKHRSAAEVEEIMDFMRQGEFNDTIQKLN